jgi:hypothetical protein
VYIDNGIRDYKRFINLPVIAVDTKGASTAALTGRLEVSIMGEKKRKCDLCGSNTGPSD